MAATSGWITDRLLPVIAFHPYPVVVAPPTMSGNPIAFAVMMAIFMIIGMAIVMAIVMTVANGDANNRGGNEDFRSGGDRGAQRHNGGDRIDECFHTDLMRSCLIAAWFNHCALFKESSYLERQAMAS